MSQLPWKWLKNTDWVRPGDGESVFTVVNDFFFFLHTQLHKSALEKSNKIVRDQTYT